MAAKKAQGAAEPLDGDCSEASAESTVLERVIPMGAAFLQIVMTVWIGAHPVTYTVPDLYKATDYDKCSKRVDAIFAHRKKATRMVIECVPTDKREA